MIRRGRREGWFRRPIASFRSWAELNGASFGGVKCGLIAEDRGSGVIATRELKGGEEEPLMVVPRDLVLSLEAVNQAARLDKALRELLEALGDYTRTPRGALLVFLLYQATIACLRQQGITFGTLNPFTEYVKFLPAELLPTFWLKEEQELLAGTSLEPALAAKLRSLQDDYENLRTATENVAWCQEYWWDEETGLLSFDDWMQVDAMYRSRALEFPGIGDSMVPCIDMSNHAAGNATAALYETDNRGNAILLLRDSFDLKEGEEITITYGDAKGACEMLFSYGFIEDSMTSAKELFLDLEMSDDDPLSMAKLRVANAAPGVKISETEGQMDWYSDFIWLICVNEEDGLRFLIMQTNDGGRELVMSWKDAEVPNSTDLRGLLEQDPKWDVFRLRAVAVIQRRVEMQQRLLDELGFAESVPHGEGTPIRQQPWNLAVRLRELESEILMGAHAYLEEQKMKLVESAVVQQYLAEAREAAEEDEDFT